MPGGRPTAYDPECIKIVKAMAKLGATNADLASEFEVSHATIDNWMIKHPEFLGALKEGKEAFDQRIERSLAQKAIGYERPVVKTTTFENEDGGTTVSTVEYVEHVPPDTTACIFWLKNRKPKEWRDRHEFSGDPENPLQIVHAVQLIVTDSREDWDKIAADRDRLCLPAPEGSGEV
jgi:transposase-like protein